MSDLPFVGEAVLALCCLMFFILTMHNKGQALYSPCEIIALSSGLSEFDAPQEEVDNARNDKPQFETNVRTAQDFGKGTSEEELGGSKVDSYKAESHSNDGCPTEREFAPRIPVIGMVFAISSTPEDEMLDNENNRPGTEPVCDKQQEIGQCVIKVGSSRHSNEHIDYSPNQRPDSTIDTLEPLTEHLHREPEAVIVGNIGGNDAECKQYQEQGTKATKGMESS
jgi:hypothetical protein